MAPKTHLVSVFTAPSSPETGGNPCPIVLDASELDDAEMRSVAAHHGHESAFLMGADGKEDRKADSVHHDHDHDHDYDYELRFFVPEHEMEMCGHATAGTTWVLHELGRLGQQGVVRYLTKSGVVRARIIREGGVPGGGGKTQGQEQEATVVAEISQPRGIVGPITDEALLREILDVLGISTGELRPGVPVQNARTSRVKTVVPVRSVGVLDGLRPDFGRVEELCERLGSTGLYPYAVDEAGDGDGAAGETRVGARQFPKASGYSEDAATGIAAAALSWALLENGMLGEDGKGKKKVVVRQGVAMGCPSEIRVRLEEGLEGLCWIGGTARWMGEGRQS